MAAYRRVFDSRHLQADYQEPGSAPEPYARQSSMGYLSFLSKARLTSMPKTGLKIEVESMAEENLRTPIVNRVFV